MLLILNSKLNKRLKRQKQEPSDSVKTTYFDNVTGLATMMMFKDALAYSTSKPKDKEPLAVMALSLKAPISYLDEIQKGILLKSMVRRIKDSLRATDFIARADDGTFYILLTRIGTVENIKMIADRLLGVFRNDFNVTEELLILTPYIGIALYPNEEDDLDMLISNANTAMKELRNEEKSGYNFFQKEHLHGNNRQEVLVSDLKEALKNQEFVLHYQPQYSLEEKRIVGVEALIRWNHPKRGLLAPYYFLSVAENSSFMEDITNWVLREASRQHKAWNLDNIDVSVNISATQFKSDSFVDQVEAAVRLTDIKPENLKLEITETTSIEDKEYTTGILKQLKQRGYKISIDDFGVGQSSLSYIKDFTIDYIKLDRSFIQDLENNSTGKVILTSIIKMAKELNLKVVAEGVETKEHLEFLRAEGCTEIQGYYLSKPIPPDELYKFITSESYQARMTINNSELVG